MRTRESHNLLLIPELETLVDIQVASGCYRCAREVVRATLRLPDERECRIEQRSFSIGMPHAG